MYFREDQGLFGYVYELDLSERDPKSMRESFAAFKELVAEVPGQPLRRGCAARMRYLDERARRCTRCTVARYYYSRGAYVAAANRAQACAPQFPADAGERACARRDGASYTRLGLTQLADDAQQILTKTFPHSIYVAGATDVAWWKVW